MTTCPRCGASSRTDPTALSLKPALQVSPVGTHSLAGVQMKFSARTAHRLTCRCGWTVTGQIENGQLIVTPDPTTEG